MRVAVIAGFAPSLVNFRGELLREMVALGHTVLALAPERDEGVIAKLGEYGVAFEQVPLVRAGLNPLADLRTLAAITRTLRRFRAEVTLAYTAKPVIYGTLAARLAGVRTRCAMITGVGSSLRATSGARALVSAAMRGLYAVALRSANVVLFQNPDDEALFRRLNLLGPAQRVVLVDGSGVDLQRFAARPLPSERGPTFLLVGRLLRDKGVVEFVEASRLVRRTHPQARFVVVGGRDSNPSCITEAELARWRAEGLVEFLGPQPDVAPHLAACHVFVLPSYGEGMPRSTLEALATGRPIVTTDVPGCRETVRADDNGLLVPARDAPALAKAMAQLAGAERAVLVRMSAQSRLLAEERFDVRKVNRAVLRAMGLSLGEPSGHGPSGSMVGGRR